MGPTTVTLPRKDARIEQIAQDPAGYYAEARLRALTEARKDVGRKLARRLRHRLLATKGR